MRGDSDADLLYNEYLFKWFAAELHGFVASI